MTTKTKTKTKTKTTKTTETMRSRRWVVTTAAGTEEVLAEELAEIGVEVESSEAGSAVLRGGLDAAYRVGLLARIPSRVLLPIATFDAPNPDALYDAVRAIPWEEHLDLEGSFVVRCAASRERRGDHTRFLALRTKDGIVDRFRDRTGRRPDVDREAPDVRVHVRWADPVVVSIDLFGPLHERGYRLGGPRGAPLRETLAAAVLRLAGYQGGPFVDPMCGTGTLAIEAACVAAGLAPGRTRTLGGWRGHDPELWTELRSAARDRARDRTEEVAVHGFDASPEAIEMAVENARRAGVHVAFSVRDLRDAEPPRTSAGHVVMNPPWGQRLGSRGELAVLYGAIGDQLKQHFGGWTAHLLTGEPALLRQVGLRASRRHVLFAGPIECRLARYELRAPKSTRPGPSRRRPRPESDSFANRLRKNRKKLGKWARREGFEAWRCYDADIPEYAVSVDVYGGELMIYEHARSGRVDDDLLDDRLRDAVTQAEIVFEPARVHVRSRGRGPLQYEKRGATGRRFAVREQDATLLVNLDDYLDTGVFLDHRALRGELAARCAQGTRVLNLFAYTCTASVRCALAGAHTTSVDLSATYLDWGRDNFEANGLDPNAHEFVRADVLEWLRGRRGRFDLVFMAPPSFSRSKGMEEELDLLRDHAELVADAMRCVAEDGTLVFSSHARGLTLDRSLKRFDVEDRGDATVPADFRRSPHRTWELRHRDPR